MAVVVMDRKDHINKSHVLMDQDTYESISKDPTPKLKNQLICVLKDCKIQG